MMDREAHLARALERGIADAQGEGNPPCPYTVGVFVKAWYRGFDQERRRQRETRDGRTPLPIIVFITGLLLIGVALAGCQSAPPEPPAPTPEARQCQALYPPFQPLHCPLYGCAGACLDLAPARTWDALQRWLTGKCGSDPACGDARRIADAMRPVFGGRP